MIEHLFLSEIPGFDTLYNHLLNAFDTTDADIFWKDKQGKYLGVNKKFLHYAAAQSYDDVIGRTDLDLSWAQWAPIMRQNDSEVIYSGIPKRIIEPCKVNNEICFFLNHKKPLLSRAGKIIGVFGIAIPLKRKNGTFSNLTLPGLTKRQTECVYYLMKGKTAKEIANILNRSHRTIEKHLDTLKMIWDCNSKSELLEKAFHIVTEFESEFQIL